MLRIVSLLVLVLLSGNSVLFSAEKAVDDWPMLEEELKLQIPAEPLRLWRQRVCDKLQAHTPLPAVLIQLIAQHLPDPYPIWIDYLPISRDENERIGHTFHLITMHRNMPELATIEVYLGGSCSIRAPTPWQNSLLVQTITRRLALAHSMTHQQLYINDFECSTAAALKRLGVSYKALYCLTPLLGNNFQVSNSCKSAQGGRRADSALLLHAGYTLLDLSDSVKNLYEKCIAVQHTPDYALLQRENVAELEEFVQKYREHGAQFSLACKRVSEQEDEESLDDDWVVIE